MVTAFDGNPGNIQNEGEDIFGVGVNTTFYSAVSILFKLLTNEWETDVFILLKKTVSLKNTVEHK